MHSVSANDASIPALGFGTWELRGRTARELVEAALEIGYRHVDTAQMYGNEAEVGAAIAASGVPRDELFVTTKVWPDRFRKGDLERSVEESVRRLGLRPDLVLLRVLGAVMPLRSTERDEAIGMDVVWHGEEAYASGEGAILIEPADEPLPVANPV